MKRMTLIALVAAVLAFAGQAWAGVSGSSHDVAAALGPAAAGFGVCSSCHIPHKAVGDRLWPQPITGTSASRGDVGNLCTYCHEQTNGVLGGSRTPYPFKDQQANTHGMIKANLPDVAGSFDTTLPYMSVAGAAMQCTSCHNVHDQSLAGRLAYLQADIDVLCARCHSNRQFINGVAQNGAAAAEGAWGATRYGYDSTGAAGNPGSHPVGTDILGDISTHNWNGTGPTADTPVMPEQFLDRPHVRTVAQQMGVSLDGFGFVAPSEDLLNPFATSRGGVFACGLCQSPMDVPDSAVRASAAASKVAEVLASCT